MLHLWHTWEYRGSGSLVHWDTVCGVKSDRILHVSDVEVTELQGGFWQLPASQDSISIGTKLLNKQGRESTNKVHLKHDSINKK
jgi:hypothetical protein